MTAGVKLGPYELIAPVGSGGMGEVWKARDTRLNRSVAIKISAAQFSDRFEREARAIAALNHAHICAIYDVGPDYLVMEYVEGEPIKGPLPLAKALDYAKQILEALHAAHRAGIVHRDLKPANILVGKSGVKVLDFGLAKMQQAPAIAGDDRTELSNAITREGTIAGTLQYMAPEQLQAKEVDSRADIFSFGCVLFEMLTGQRAFEGKSAASIIAAVLEREAPSVAEVAPPSMDWVLKKCLAKDPEERWQSALDIRTQLEWLASGPEAPPRSRRLALWPIAAAIALLAAALVSLPFRESPDRARTIRSAIQPPQNSSFAASAPAFSPDGTRIAFQADGRLWVRGLESLTPQPLTGTEGGTLPFWSPGSKSIGFFAAGKLKTIDITGGRTLTLAEVDTAEGGSWSKDGIIVFAPHNLARPLMKVPAGGGAVIPATELDSRRETGHRWPYFLPDGKHFVFIALTGLNRPAIRIGSLDSRTVISAGFIDSNAVFSRGHLLFLRGSTLMAQPFNAKHLMFTGDPVPVAEQVGASSLFLGYFSASETGMLAYAGGSGTLMQLTSFDRTGKRLGLLGEQAVIATRIEFSPDRKKLAASLQDPVTRNVDIWLFDTSSGVRTRFTFDPGNESDAVWSPDGSRIIFNSNRMGHADLYRRRSNSAGPEELLYSSNIHKLPMSISPDGKFLLYETFGHPGTGWDLWILPAPFGPIGGSKPYPYLVTSANEIEAQFSPNGKWVAYQSDETGRYEVYVAPFPANGSKRQISFAGGMQPRWRHDGREIFYYSPGNVLTAAPIAEAGGAIEVGQTRILFGPLPSAGWYDVSLDGQRFLKAMPPEPPSGAALTLIQNWPAALSK